MRHRPNRYQELSLRRAGRCLWHVQLSSLLEFAGREGFWNRLLSSKSGKIFKLAILSSFLLGLTKMMPGKTEGRRRRRRQDEMVGWHHWLNGHEFQQTLEVGEGQGGLACCSPWGRKESDTTERLNSNKNFPKCCWKNIFQSTSASLPQTNQEERLNLQEGPNLVLDD